MTLARPRAIALAALVVVALAGCVPGDAASTHDHSASPAPGSPGALTSPVEGVPIDIEAEGFTQVTAFTIRTDDGQQLRFLLGPLENATAVPADAPRRAPRGLDPDRRVLPPRGERRGRLPARGRADARGVALASP